MKRSKTVKPTAEQSQAAKQELADLRRAALSMLRTNPLIREAQDRAEKSGTTQARDGLLNVVAGLGTTRDKHSWTHYGLTTTVTRNELENIYRSSWLGKRIVNAVADDMVRGWRNWQFAKDDEENQFVASRAEKVLGVREKIGEALRWARLYGGSIIIMGIEGQDPATPLDVRTVKRGSLKWLHVRDRWWVTYGGETPGARTTHTNVGSVAVPTDGMRTLDIGSPNFGKPEVYTIAESGVRVHWTRVLRFDGELLPYSLFIRNQMWGDSVLQHTIASLKNIDSTTAAIASLIFESNVDVVSVEGLADLLSQEDGDRRLIQRFQAASLLKSNNRMMLLDSRETYDKKAAHYENLDKIWSQFMMDVSGAADIPIMRLFGQSAAGFNATGDNDIRNYYDAVLVRCERDLRPQLERLDEVLLRSALGYFPEDYRFEFGSLWQISDTEKAVIEKDRATRDEAYLRMGVVSEGLIARELREHATYSSMTDEDVEEAEELGQALADPELDQETPGEAPASSPADIPEKGGQPRASSPAPRPKTDAPAPDAKE